MNSPPSICPELALARGLEIKGCSGLKKKKETNMKKVIKQWEILIQSNEQ
jgi:hypothetical protein